MSKTPPDQTRLVVDPVSCEAVGFCAHLAAEVVVLDRWGYPVVPREPLAPGDLPAVRRALRACPRRALSLVAAPRP
jgi:ferredoxin